MRVCYFGTYRAEYARNQTMIDGLRRNGVQVFECHAPLWRGVEDRVQAASGGWLKVGFALRVARAYVSLLRQHAAAPEYDVLMCGYPGQLDVYLARLLAWSRRKPLVWDIFMSIYLIACERGLDRRSPLTAALLKLVEGLAGRLPDMLIIDTAEYETWLRRTHGWRAQRLRLTPTGADGRLFQPAPARPADGALRVAYAGTFIRNHGVPYMLAAAEWLAGEPRVSFEFIGDGPERAAAEARARAAGLARVTFSGWLSEAEVAARLAQADVILGAFGQTPQSLMTIQNKIYNGLALERPVVSGDSVTVRAALQHGEQIWLVDRERPEALAEALLVLWRDPGLRQKLAQNGRRIFEARYTPEALGRVTRGYLEEAVRGRQG